MKRSQRDTLSRARRAIASVAATLATASLVYAEPSVAPAEPKVERFQKVTVTGSLIPLQTLESESPISIITGRDIEFTGLTTVSDVLNQLPMVAPETGTVNLRNLGSTRTLVLIDGRRLPAGDTQNWATDTSQIPASLIKRVEILTGGASAIYGSDAVAGVVNFIMNDHFDGIELSYNGGGYNHRQHDSSGVSSAVAALSADNPSQFHVPGNVGLDGQVHDFNVTLGRNFASGTGNVTAYFEYRKVQPVVHSARDFSACIAGTNNAGTDFICGGSSTSYPGRFTDLNTGSSFTIADAAGNVRPYDPATDQFNFGSYQVFQGSDERYIFDAFAHYDLFPDVRVYGEFEFMDEKNEAHQAPSGTFFGVDTYTLYDSNPLLSPAFKTAFGITPATPGMLLIGRRNVEGGDRVGFSEHKTYRTVIGAKGDFLNGQWDYDAWWQSGKVVNPTSLFHDFSLPRISNALDVVTDPANGQPVCASALDGSDPSCVPWDIFHIGGVTQAMLNYLGLAGYTNGYTLQDVVGLHINSDLGDAYGWRLPWAKSGIGVAVAAEHRKEKLVFNTNDFYQVPLGASQGGPTLPVSGQYSVKEFFGELRVPVVENQPWVRAINFNAAYRWSNYTTTGSARTYGLGAEWLVAREARLRGTYQQAVRAPNIIDLYTPQGTSLFTMSADPCGPTMGATLEQCLRTGLKPNQYGQDILDDPGFQYHNLVGGNPGLNPETANSYTVGAVLQPIAKLGATIDYWNIRIDKVIGTIAPTLALNQCLSAGQFCDLIHRDPNFGTLWLTGGYITSTNINLGKLKTEGVDVTVDWTQRLGDYGDVSIYFVGTWLDHLITEPVPGLGSYNCSGLYGSTCGLAPKWRSRLQSIWSTPWKWDFGATWRYFSSVAIDQGSSNPLLAGAFDPKIGHLGTRSYLDVVAEWKITDNLLLRGGANNLFDRDPPITAIGSNANTYPQTYDALGRYLFLNVTAKF